MAKCRSIMDAGPTHLLLLAILIHQSSGQVLASSSPTARTFDTNLIPPTDHQNPAPSASSNGNAGHDHLGPPPSSSLFGQKEPPVEDLVPRLAVTPDISVLGSGQGDSIDSAEGPLLPPVKEDRTAATGPELEEDTDVNQDRPTASLSPLPIPGVPQKQTQARPRGDPSTPVLVGRDPPTPVSTSPSLSPLPLPPPSQEPQIPAAPHTAGSPPKTESPDLESGKAVRPPAPPLPAPPLPAPLDPSSSPIQRESPASPSARPPTKPPVERVGLTITVTSGPPGPGHTSSASVTMGTTPPGGRRLVIPSDGPQVPIATAAPLTQGADSPTVGTEAGRGNGQSSADAPATWAGDLAEFQRQAQTPSPTTAAAEPPTPAPTPPQPSSTLRYAESNTHAPYSTSQELQPQPTRTRTTPANPELTSQSGDQATTSTGLTPVSTLATTLTGTERLWSRSPPQTGHRGERGRNRTRIVPGSRETGGSSTVTLLLPLTTANQQTKTARTQSTLSTSPPPSSSPSSSSAPLRPGGGRALDLDGNDTAAVASVPLGRPVVAPSPSALMPSSPSAPPCMRTGAGGPCMLPPNRTALLWADLRRTLSFAWEMHVYGSASLFLLLSLGGLLGLLLPPPPGVCGTPRGCLALTNTLLLLAGAVRAAYLFTDPYGTRELLTQPAMVALHNLPFPLLLWALAALCLLAVEAAGVSVLPAGLQRPPLAAVLALLHCTVQTAADFLSQALSPAVPAVLQALSVAWGCSLCVGFLFCVFPRLRYRTAPPALGGAGAREEAGGCGAGGRRQLRVLARVLCVCAVLGALCCGLQVQAALWLAGLLGDRRRFTWAWWLGQFCGRLLELGWASCMLLLASRPFWCPAQERGRSRGAGEEEEEGRAGRASSSSSSSHTCWAKILQCARGRQRRKAESNGVSGSNGGGGTGSAELPNNQAHQDRAGADISKSLIRNRAEALPLRSLKDINSSAGHSQQGGSTGSLQWPGGGALLHRSLSSLSLEKERGRESILSLTDFDLRPPSPIDLSRSIDEALHLVRGGLFSPRPPPSPPPSPPTHSVSPPPGPCQPLLSPGAPPTWPRRSSEPQLWREGEVGGAEMLAATQAAGGAPHIPPPAGEAAAEPRIVPPSLSCPVSLTASRWPPRPRPRPLRTGDDTLPFLPREERPEEGVPHSQARRSHRSQPDSVSVCSDTIDL
ncbi:proline-rich transmembrane protein 3 [Amia ocellicauda]|uniref:proline-rich transmembrane protein 3 n=1 Tax=Amia ocellicauda TaxID=2972642 RepID=UPI0034643857